MIARMRLRNGLTGALALALALIGFTGCRSSCGSGCCRTQTGNINPIVTAPASQAVSNDRMVAPNSAAAPGPTGGATAQLKPYGGQKTCPVMDEELGAMGPPISVTVKGETIYVCCRGCAAKVQRDPDRYLPKVLAERAASAATATDSGASSDGHAGHTH